MGLTFTQRHHLGGGGGGGAPLKQRAKSPFTAGKGGLEFDQNHLLHGCGSDLEDP